MYGCSLTRFLTVLIATIIIYANHRSVYGKNDIYMDNNSHFEIACYVFCIRYSFWLVLLV